MKLFTCTKIRQKYNNDINKDMLEYYHYYFDFKAFQ